MSKLVVYVIKDVKNVAFLTLDEAISWHKYGHIDDIMAVQYEKLSQEQKHFLQNMHSKIVIEAKDEKENAN